MHFRGYCSSGKINSVELHEVVDILFCGQKNHNKINLCLLNIPSVLISASVTTFLSYVLWHFWKKVTTSHKSDGQCCFATLTMLLQSVAVLLT